MAKDSSSNQYECKYQLATSSHKKNRCKNVRKIGMDVTDEVDVNLKREDGVEECIQGTKRMVIENLPAARIHGKFSLNLPYVFIIYLLGYIVDKVKNRRLFFQAAWG